MRPFAEIIEISRTRHGDAAMHGFHGVAAPKSSDELAEVPDDRYLAMATRCVFQSGFNWKVIEAKWPGFEEAFEGFDLGRWVMASDDDIGRLASDRRIVRNGAKIASVPQNARYFAAKSREHGGVGRWIGAWPTEDFVGLLRDMDKGGSRLGAATTQYFLRFIGKDGFILSRDVVAALIRDGVIPDQARDKPVTSAKAMSAIQNAFNRWREESGHCLTAISQTLARSIDA